MRSRRYVRVWHDPDLDQEPLERCVGDTAEERTEREGYDTERNGDTPLAAAAGSHLERGAADEHNQDPHCNLCGNVSKT